VAGDPDILLAPDLEAGNMMAKMLSFSRQRGQRWSGAGARVPVILTSRARQRAVAHRELRRCGHGCAHARRQPPR
jgi:phosphotransacetylase